MSAALTLLFQNSAGQVLADAAGFLRLVWSSQPRQLAATQAVFGAVAQGLRQRHYAGLLVDQTYRPPFSPDEQRWVTHEWLPGEGKASGCRFGAILVASSVLARLATAYITTSNAENAFLRYRSFDDEPTAVAWLLRQQA